MALVNPRNTSQQCSRCGMIVKKTLSDRTHTCLPALRAHAGPGSECGDHNMDQYQDWDCNLRDSISCH
ncbi:MAG: transposase [Candidatus Methanoculleus thermohydrogenotrophicum]|nr:transposase [Candidatus Methanoculleus thermohydrogenotrophicum]